MKSKWAYWIGAWVLLTGLSTPVFGKVTSQEVQSLVERHGKEPLIAAVLKLRNNQITVQVRGGLREFTGPPSPEFITVDTLVRDLNEASVDAASVEEILGTQSGAGPAERSDSPSRLPSTVSYPSERNPLWIVSAGRNHVYLLGSLHFFRSDYYPLSMDIENAYDRCERIVFETDIGGIRNPETLKRLMTLGVYPSDKTLAREISGETYDLLEKEIKALGLPMAQFERFRPWLCALTIVTLELQKLGFDPTHGIDQYFFNRAKKDGKEGIFLETIDYQLGLFANMNKTEEEAFLSQTLRDLQIVESMAGETLRAWKTGDAQGLGTIMQMSFKDYPGLYDRMIVQRNREWLGKIEGLMKQGKDVLVVVGVGHLVGSQSLIDLLRSRGHEVVQG